MISLLIEWIEMLQLNLAKEFEYSCSSSKSLLNSILIEVKVVYIASHPAL